MRKLSTQFKSIIYFIKFLEYFLIGSKKGKKEKEKRFKNNKTKVNQIEEKVLKMMMKNNKIQI